VPVSLEQSALVAQVPGLPATQQPSAQCWCEAQSVSRLQVGAATPQAVLTQVPLTQVCGDGQSVEVVQVCSAPPP
jgi:hypothetical protein